MENNIQAQDAIKEIPDEKLEHVAGGVDLSMYTQEELAGIFEYYYSAFGPHDEDMAAKMVTFGVTEDDLKQSRRIALSEGGKSSHWPWYLAGMMMERYN